METTTLENIAGAGRRSIDLLLKLNTFCSAAPSQLWRHYLNIYPDWISNIGRKDLRFIIGEHFTGRDRTSYEEFRSLDSAQIEELDFVKRYRVLCEGVPKTLHLSEPRFADAPPWGVSVNGRQLSANVTRYQTFMSTLYHWRLLDLPTHATVLEIGGGSGQFCYHFTSAVPCRYVIVDIPHTLYLAAAVCSITMPQKRLFVFDPALHMNIRFCDVYDEFDLFFLPTFMMEQVYAAAPYALAFNFWSMQEMTEAQVSQYCSLLQYCLDGWFYSCNFPRHLHNYELKSPLGDLFRRYLHVSPDSESVPRSAWDDVSHLCTSPLRPYALPSVARRVLFNTLGPDQEI